MSQIDLLVATKVVALLWCFGAYALALVLAFMPKREAMQAHAQAILEDA